MKELFGEVISSYTRAEAIEDGTLVDVSETAKEMGFRFPVAITRTVYEGHIKVEGTRKSGDTAGRLWDCLWMLFVQIKAGRGGSQVLYSVLFGRKTVYLKALVGPGDHGEPVITIMFPKED